jgi:type II secretory pathway pseudopilin PulG
MKYLKNEKGAALILVIIVMVVVSILGAALLTTSLADAKHAIRQENVIQANYLARAAVDDIADYIIANEHAPGMVGSGKSFSYGSYVIDQITVNAAQSEFYVQATGTARGMSSTVALTVTRDLPSWVLDQAIFTYGDLNIEQMKVEGDIGSNGTVTFSTSGANAYDDVTYDATPGMEKDYESITISTDHAGGTIDINASTTPVISASGKYRNITVDNHDTLRFNTGAGLTLQVGVSVLDVANHGTVLVEGTGTLELYVYGGLDSKGAFYRVYDGTNDPELEFHIYDGVTAKFQTPLSLVENDDPNKVRFFLGKDATLFLIANGTYNCFIIGPEANVVMQSSQTHVNGAIFGNILDGNGNKPMGEVTWVTPDDTWQLVDARLNKRFYRNP